MMPNVNELVGRVANLKPEWYAAAAAGGFLAGSVLPSRRIGALVGVVGVLLLGVYQRRGGACCGSCAGEVSSSSGSEVSAAPVSLAGRFMDPESIIAISARVAGGCAR